jgi:hypothetical protein
MPSVTIERALFTRDRSEPPKLIARTGGIAEHHFARLSSIITGFGDRPAGVACPGAMFAQPIDVGHVAVIRVRDTGPGPTGWAGLSFDALIATASDYAGLGGNPFALSNAAGPTFADAPQPFILPAVPLAPRSLNDVQAVLKRIKAHALPEDFDPKNPPPLTVENAESPVLLGGVQILVDGGKLVFERPTPDASLLEAVWTLLPCALRPRLWPATFAFGNSLGFDVLVVPKVDVAEFPGYTTEEAAADYPAGSYELALQTAAESGTPADLEAVFGRRTSNDTLKLAVKLLVGMSLLALALRFLQPRPEPPTPDVMSRAAFAAGIVGTNHPWTAHWLIDQGNRLFLKRDADAK